MQQNKTCLLCCMDQRLVMMVCHSPAQPSSLSVSNGTGDCCSQSRTQGTPLHALWSNVNWLTTWRWWSQQLQSCQRRGLSCGCCCRGSHLAALQVSQGQGVSSIHFLGKIIDLYIIKGLQLWDHGKTMEPLLPFFVQLLVDPNWTSMDQLQSSRTTRCIQSKRVDQTMSFMWTLEGRVL